MGLFSFFRKLGSKKKKRKKRMKPEQKEENYPKEEKEEKEEFEDLGPKPLCPQNLELISSTINTITVSWTIPNKIKKENESDDSDNIPKVCDEYYIEYKVKGTKNWVSSDMIFEDDQYTINELNDNTTYYVRIFGNHSFNPNNYSEYSQILIVKTKINNKISNLFNRNQRRLLTKWIIKNSKLKNPRFDKIYIGTKHGFSSKSFHKYCDNIGYTLIIIKSEYNNIFGAFTTVPWTSYSTKGIYKSDPNSFLFLLTVDINNINLNNYTTKKYKINYSTNTIEWNQLFKVTKKGSEYSVCHSSNCGPIFGMGYDLFISNNCNINQNSYTRFPFSYFKYKKDNLYPLLGGKEWFKVKEMEVFRIF